MGLGLLAAVGCGHRPLGVELEVGLGALDLERVAPAPPRERRGRGPRVGERFGDDRRGLVRPAKTSIELVVVEPGVGADPAAVEARVAGLAAGRRARPPSSPRGARPRAPGCTRHPRARPAASARPCPARRCSSPAGGPPASRADPGRTWAATSAMWIHRRHPSPSGCAETASSKSRADGGVDREGVERGQVPALVPVARCAAESAACDGLAPRSRRPKARARAPPPRAARRRRRAARFGEPSSRTARASRPSRSTSTIVPAAGVFWPPASGTCGPGSNSGSATRNRPRFATTATKPGVCLVPGHQLPSIERSSSMPASRPSSAGVAGSSLASTSGWTPLPASDSPSEVTYSPIVRSSAPPAGSAQDLLDGVLAVRACADQGAPGRSLGARPRGSPPPRPCRG